MISGFTSAPFFREPDGVAFGAAAYGASDLVCCRFGVRAGQRPVGENAFGCFDLMDELCQCIDIIERDDGSIFLVFGRRGQGASDTKERPLNLFGPGADLLVMCRCCGRSRAPYSTHRRSRKPRRAGLPSRRVLRRPIRSVRCLRVWLRCSSLGSFYADVDSFR